MKQLEIAKKVQETLSFRATHRQIIEIVDSYKDLLIQELYNGNSANIQGLGSFSVVKRRPKKGYNVHTKQVIEIPERNGIKFKASPMLINSINA